MFNIIENLKLDQDWRRSTQTHYLDSKPISLYSFSLMSLLSGEATNNNFIVFGPWLYSIIQYLLICAVLINVKRLHNYVNIDATEIQVTGNNLATFCCMSKARAWISNNVWRSIYFTVPWFEVREWLLFNANSAICHLYHGGLRWELAVHFVDIGVTVLLLFIFVI